jgi:hypothetical protein
LLCDEQVQCARQDLREIAAGVGVPEQVARLFELRFQGGVRGELDLVALRREGFDAMAWQGRRGRVVALRGRRCEFDWWRRWSWK